MTCTLPGVVKAWVRHHKQIDQIAQVRGAATLALFDDRPGSPSVGRTLECALSDDPALVQIRPGVWHGFQAGGPEPLYLLHLNSIAPELNGDPDEDRLPRTAPRSHTLAMILSLITDDVRLAAEAERAGIDRVMIDLEREGKAQRQAGRNLFQSSHRLESVGTVKDVLQRAALVVRINPLSEQTPQEIEAVLAAGADVIMLPYFFTASDVAAFVGMVDGRSRVSLLVETKSAAERVKDCLAAGHMDEVHIGLNNLSIKLGCDVMLEPMCTGADRLRSRPRSATPVPFGVGGIGRLSCESLPVHPEQLWRSRCGWDVAEGGLDGRSATGWGLPAEGPKSPAFARRSRRWGAASEEAWRENRRSAGRRILGWKASRGAGAGVCERRVGGGRGVAPAMRGGVVRWLGLGESRLQSRAVGASATEERLKTGTQARPEISRTRRECKPNLVFVFSSRYHARLWSVWARVLCASKDLVGNAFLAFSTGLARSTGSSCRRRPNERLQERRSQVELTADPPVHAFGRSRRGSHAALVDAADSSCPGAE